jgi:sec-independent protein translocase protein TatB
MFDIGFSELMVIALVALIVIGPERLPRVARTLGHLAGRLQRYVADVKADINREVELEELRKMRDSVQQSASSMESSFNAELRKTESELNAAVEGAPAQAAEAATAPLAGTEAAGASQGNAETAPAPQAKAEAAAAAPMPGALEGPAKT